MENGTRPELRPALEPADAAKAPGQPTVEDVVQMLRTHYGDQYQESYEHGKREFEHLLRDAFDMDSGDARRFLADLEQAQLIRYIGEPNDYTEPAPRIGLFDEPGEGPSHGGRHDAYPGRHWRIGRSLDD